MALQGDSIAQAVADSRFPAFVAYLPQTPWYGGGGFWCRALSGNGGFINQAISGDQAGYYLPNAHHFRRQTFTSMVKYVVIEYGVNDLGGALISAAQLQTYLIQLALQNLRRGVSKVFIQTLTPESTCTSGTWQTVAEQTPLSFVTGTRATHNAWVRGGCQINPTTLAPVTSGGITAGSDGHPIAGWFDVAAQVESGGSSSPAGVWIAPKSVVTDGSCTNGTYSVTSTNAAFNATNVGDNITVVGAGAASSVTGCSSSGTTLTLGTATPIVNGSTVSITSGTGTFVAGTVVSKGGGASISGVSSVTTVTLSQAPTVALSGATVQFIAPFTSQIIKLTSSTTVATTDAPSQTIASGATVIVGQPTLDGIHPCTTINAQLGAYLKTQLSAFTG